MTITERWDNIQERLERLVEAIAAKDAKIARLEADLEHYRHSSLIAAKERLVAKTADALSVAVNYGQIDGEHHKVWVIDQMVRALAGSNYDALVARARSGDSGPETYAWDCGVAP